MIDQKGGQNQWLHLTGVTLRSAPAGEPFVRQDERNKAMTMIDVEREFDMAMKRGTLILKQFDKGKEKG